MTAGPVAASSPAVDWPMYLHDTSLSAASSETILTPAAAPNLRPLWTYKTGGLVAASPTVVGGVVYVGSWDGYEYALNATTGALMWKTFLGLTVVPACSPPQLGVSSTASVVGSVVYVGGGDSNWYALDAATGTVLWSVPTGDNSPTGGHYNWSSPLIVGNSAYIGIASVGDCPLVQGQVLRVDLTTHLVVATSNLVPNGQLGSGVWTTPSYDPATSTVYVVTGNSNQATQTTGQAILALDATTLAIKSYWQIPPSSNPDSDFGTSPIQFTDGKSRALVAAINKNGFLYAFDRSNLALGPVWSEQVAADGTCPECGDGSVSSMAFAQGLLFAAGGNTTIGGVGYPGGIRAINPTTGAVVWAHGLADPVMPALAYDNGMVFAGSGPRLEVFDANTGARLASYSTGVLTYSPPSVSNGVVYMGNGAGSVYAFAPATPAVPPADPNCPSGMVCQDIGNPAPAGSETVTSGAWAISAGGAGIGLAAGSDQFRFMSRGAIGDLGLTARVTSLTPVGAGTQAGLMVRQSNEPGAPFYSVTYTGGATLQIQYRLAFGGAAKSVSVTAPALPVYIQVQRVGDTFTASRSTNGSTYTLVPGSTARVVMPTAVMAGLAADSAGNGTAAASTIDTVVVGAPGAPPSPPASPSPCPAGWSCTDLGNPVSLGDQALAAGTWTVKGAGVASGNNVYSDQFHLVWQAIAGDATLATRVATQQSTSASAQAGLVFRTDSTTAGAVSYGAFVTPTNGIEVVARSAEGMRTTIVASATGAAPAYLEITRYQDTFTTFTSTDGVTWTVLFGSSLTLGPSGSMVAGLVANSNSTTTLATDTFDSVSLAQSAAAPPSLCPSGWTCQDIGLPAPGPGSQYVVGPNWTVQAGGSDIWATSDSFRLLSQPLAGDGSISARVDSQSNSSSWAKAGVMIRATNDPGSPYFAEFITPGNGIAVQWRKTPGATTSQVAVVGTAPVWFEVARAGGTFTAYTSPDGINWTAVPGASVAMNMAGTVLAGLAVTSHNGGQWGTVTFDTATVTLASGGGATSLTVSGVPSPIKAGVAGSVTVTARDAYGNTVTGYTGTVHFTSSDPSAVLPADATLSSGVGTFNVTFATPGTQSVTATDTGNASISGSQGGIGVISVPGKPTNVKAAGGDGSATVSWAAAPPNGSLITSYVVTSSPGGKTCSTTGALSCTVAGLTNGVPYTFSVVAANGVGSGPASDPSAAFTPLTGATYIALNPARVLDSRISLGAGVFHSGTKQTVLIANGSSGVPTNAVAVTGNVTIVSMSGATTGGYVTVAPSLTSGVRPSTSTINFPASDTRANGVTVSLATGGNLDFVYWGASSSSTIQVLFDVTGYFTH